MRATALVPAKMSAWQEAQRRPVAACAPFCEALRHAASDAGNHFHGGNARPMPNAHRECNSPRTVRNCQDSPTSETNRRESTRNNAETASYCLTGFRREPGPSARQDVAERFEPFAERSPKRPGQLV